jgi:ABC-type polysaccharide/polyol phosphate transport system ATPase subunit
MNLPIALERRIYTMMEEEAVVLLENISVRYRAPVETYSSFKEYFIRLVQRRVNMRDVWALQEVSLQIHRGEMFGIVGCNGAGKTTLLKVISRVLAPTNGRVVVHGHVAPLLELGAGFQPELTGRENVFLNGALLGHPQQEIKAHLEEILDFAQIDGFVDSPLRTFSSGMVARLGFAVATSWEPEILILDEILGVGDEAFQAKCFARINGFLANGATILLVSHSMDTVLAHCTRAAWLDQGRLMGIGDVQDVVTCYRESLAGV